VICVGFDGASAASAPIDALRAFGPGAVILFGRNAGPAEQTRELVAALRGISELAPLIAVDQEGGRVERLHDGVAPLPSAMAFGATGDVDLVARAGSLLGRDLARLGITVDLAPVADLSLQPRSRVIGTRAYGDAPDRVAAFAGAFARGIERAGVAAALKHFPGHGSTAGDSHVVLPRVTADAATLRARDLVPFARGIAAGVTSLVVSAHVVVEAFDAQHPATLSHAILTDLLRGELGFTGVVATDCLEMDAIARGIGTVQGAVDALAAGADLLLISHHLELASEAADAIAAAVESGRLSLDRLHDAHARVERLRRRVTTLNPLLDDVDGSAPLEAAQRAVTPVIGDPPLRAGKAVTVISFEGVVSDNAAASGGAASAATAPSLSGALRRRGWKSEVMRVPLEPADDDVELLLEHVPALGDREFVVVTRDAHLAPAQTAAVARILAVAPDALIVSARSPYDVRQWPNARRAICIYGDGAIAFDGCADVLSGRAPLRGRLPVHLDGVDAIR
jgi:beta-N-acetylhexosaminidase